MCDCEQTIRRSITQAHAASDTPCSKADATIRLFQKEKAGKWLPEREELPFSEQSASVPCRGEPGRALLSAKWAGVQFMMRYFDAQDAPFIPGHYAARLEGGVLGHVTMETLSTRYSSCAANRVDAKRMTMSSMR